MPYTCLLGVIGCNYLGVCILCVVIGVFLPVIFSVSVYMCFLVRN